MNIYCTELTAGVFRAAALFGACIDLSFVTVLD